MRTNALAEDERMRKWVAAEDDFVLKQAKKKAEIRVKEGRAKPIDWLAVTLRLSDDTRREMVATLDDEIDDEDLEVVDPDAVLAELESVKEAEALRGEIESYEKLERDAKGKEYWRMMGILCEDRIKKMKVGNAGKQGRVVGAVAGDVDRLLAPKTYDELVALEEQIRAKLAGNEPIDTDYWGSLLESLLVWKAKAKLKNVYQKVLDRRLERLRKESELEAINARLELAELVENGTSSSTLLYDKALDPDPALEISGKDKALEVRDETTFLSQLETDRAKIRRTGYIPLSSTSKSKQPSHKHTTTSTNSTNTATQFDRDVARGVNEDEEIFAAEEPSEPTLPTSLPAWAATHRPRKPRHFNRVQLGYDWNKYNQTHYTADAPPPKVVQGYKFHIFYPDLLDKTKAPTYKILREGGRKRGQTLAPAGEEDTCIIRFVSPGPPYEDVAFRIVDRDWDYSAKMDRGFRSTFEGGVLSLHFSFKKVYYRK